MHQGKRILVALLTAALLVPGAAAAPGEGPALSDLQGHWAQEEIEQAVAAGWVEGYPDGTFRPEQPITRAEFTKMLQDAIHLPPDSETVAWLKSISQPQAPLTDMEDHWLAQGGWLDAALVTGMVVTEDYNYHHFRPEKQIARYEIALMTTRALGMVEEGNQHLDSLGYTDDEEILPWMKGYVRTAVAEGVLQGYPDGSFRPHATSTRAEAVVMLQRMLDNMEEGVTDDIKVQIHCENWGAAETVTLKAPLTQVVDGVLYLSARDLLEGWDEAAVFQTCSVTWDPIIQRLDGQFGAWTQFQAGVQGCAYDVLPWREDLTQAAYHLVRPARMLYGEIMVPVSGAPVTGTGAAVFNWPAAWDREKGTMVLNLKTPWNLTP